MRSAGCIVNDLADRNIDPHVRRTRARPLAARIVSPYEALVLFGRCWWSRCCWRCSSTC
jgi:4-hydroxybenzoate polyprenyltransferase